MVTTKRLNLENSRDGDESLSVSSSDGEHEQHLTTETAGQKEVSSSDEESDEYGTLCISHFWPHLANSTKHVVHREFQIPPGFEIIRGSGAVTREAVFHNDQELWFFKLPKNLDASVLANVKIKVDEDNVAATPGKVIAKVTAEEGNKKYVLLNEDRMLTDQLVNALPLALDRARFVLGKPFSRCFSLVDDYVNSVSSPEATNKVAVEASPVVEKLKIKRLIGKHEKPHKSKKAKHK
ncbi:uncharacterized protein CCR75_002972 [Bremia lactucae]|uniref:Uncharacterized protein n=1 Tax=Bremia lactucae TaxID=4779 RepID=A0A976NZT6_BRELC|nr:hypothetical protein CCR75_002972 [Bremia lactucae]